MGMDFEIEEVNCPICEGSRGELLHPEGSFQMVRCLLCQFVFLNPRPTSDSLFRFYQKYLPEEESSVESWENMMKAVFRRAANLLQQYRRDGRLLDVGTGFGFFLAEMKKRGWDATGVEISKKAMDYAKDILGLTIHPGPLEKVSFPSIRDAGECYSAVLEYAGSQGWQPYTSEHNCSQSVPFWRSGPA